MSPPSTLSVYIVASESATALHEQAQTAMQKMFGITEYGLLNTGPAGSLPEYDPVQVPPDDPRRDKAYIDLRGSIGSPELMLE
eukprot:SAG31_NODE_13242_length_883_cov_0.978316_2_plen_82_part_01